MWSSHYLPRQHVLYGTDRSGTISSGAYPTHSHQVLLGERACGHRRSKGATSRDEEDVCEPTDQAARRSTISRREKRDHRMEQCDSDVDVEIRVISMHIPMRSDRVSVIGVC